MKPFIQVVPKRFGDALGLLAGQGAAAPVLDTAPYILGVPQPGETLYAISGDVAGTITSSGWQWYADDVPLEGETNDQLSVTSALNFKDLTVIQTPYNGASAGTPSESDAAHVPVHEVLDSFDRADGAVGQTGSGTAAAIVSNRLVITPILVTEKVTNGSMEINSAWGDRNTPTTNIQSNEQAHGGTYSRKIVANANAGARNSPASGGFTAGQFVRLRGWVYPASGSGRISMSVPAIGPAAVSGASWKELVGTEIYTSGSGAVDILSASSGATIYFDDVSAGALTLASCICTWKLSGSNMSASAKVTRQAALSKPGIIQYVDTNNYVIAYIDNNAVKLAKWVGGTYTAVATSSAITYGNDKVLKVVRNWGAYEIWYDGARVLVAYINDAVFQSDTSEWGLFSDIEGNSFDDLDIHVTVTGFGSDTAGGVGGTVVHVTNTDASGAGSLAAAIATGNSIVVIFDVAGTIDLRAEADFPLYVDGANISILGQTAPGGGICVRGTITVRGHDVVIQHLRDRPGLGTDDPEQADCITITDSAALVPYNIVVDHCSLSWSVDECFNIYPTYSGHAIQDITIQYCLIYEGLNLADHPEGSHSALFFSGSSPGAKFTRITSHHNFVANARGRVPQNDCDECLMEWTNNLTYNGKDAHPYWSERFKVNLYANTNHRGPSETGPEGVFAHFRFTLIDAANADYSQAYDAGNKRIYLGVETDADVRYVVVSDASAQQLSNRFAESPLPYPYHAAASDARTDILANAGAYPRDTSDARVIANYGTNSGAIIDDPDDVGGYPTLSA